MTSEEYVAKRLDEQYEWLSRKSSANQRWYRRLRTAEICLAGSVPVLAAYAMSSSTAQLGAALAGAFTAIVAGSMGLWKHQELWVQYRATAEALQREKMLFLTHTSPYDDPATAFNTLVNRVESLLGSDTASWSQSLQRKADMSGRTNPPMIEGASRTTAMSRRDPATRDPRESSGF
jgi:hypothetical protein